MSPIDSSDVPSEIPLPSSVVLLTEVEVHPCLFPRLLPRLHGGRLPSACACFMRRKTIVT